MTKLERLHRRVLANRGCQAAMARFGGLALSQSALSNKLRGVTPTTIEEMGTILRFVERFEQRKPQPK